MLLPIGFRRLCLFESSIRRKANQGQNADPGSGSTCKADGERNLVRRGTKLRTTFRGDRTVARCASLLSRQTLSPSYIGTMRVNESVTPRQPSHPARNAHRRYMHCYAAFAIAHCVWAKEYIHSHLIRLVRRKMALTASSSVLCVCACQAEKSWSKERCCETNIYSCGSDCTDRTASSDYLYRLSPGDPERYEPTGDDTYYQSASPTYWPIFGALAIGFNGPPGTNGYCSQGTTSRGSNNEACGGTGNWDHTDLEVWKRA